MGGNGEMWGNVIGISGVIMERKVRKVGTRKSVDAKNEKEAEHISVNSGHIGEISEIAMLKIRTPWGGKSGENIGRVSLAQLEVSASGNVYVGMIGEIEIGLRSARVLSTPVVMVDYCVVILH